MNNRVNVEVGQSDNEKKRQKSTVSVSAEGCAFEIHQSCWDRHVRDQDKAKEYGGQDKTEILYNWSRDQGRSQVLEHQKNRLGGLELEVIHGKQISFK